LFRERINRGLAFQSGSGNLLPHGGGSASDLLESRDRSVAIDRDRDLNWRCRRNIPRWKV
jgi:hypothetical protein